MSFNAAESALPRAKVEVICWYGRSEPTASYTMCHVLMKINIVKGKNFGEFRLQEFGFNKQTNKYMWKISSRSFSNRSLSKIPFLPAIPLSLEFEQKPSPPRMGRVHMYPGVTTVHEPLLCHILSTVKPQRSQN